MFSHVVIGTDDLEVSRKFYDAVFETLGVLPGRIDDWGRLFYKRKDGLFIVSKPIDGGNATFANGGTIGLAAGSPKIVDAWHAAGIANGGTSCEDPPGIRQRPFGDLYIAYLRDPYSNKLCALHWL